VAQQPAAAAVAALLSLLHVLLLCFPDQAVPLHPQSVGRQRGRLRRWHLRVGRAALLRVLLLRMPQCPLYPAIRGLRCKGTVSWRYEGWYDLHRRVDLLALLRVLLLLLPQCPLYPAIRQKFALHTEM
jgi:uncharacterized protein YlaN (UPF0358 family)